MKPDNWQDALRALLPDDYVAPADEPAAAEPAKPVLRLTLDRKRAGKTATIVSGFDPDDQRATTLAAELKRSLACGGSARGGEILLQGDRREKVAEMLRQKGYKVKM